MTQSNTQTANQVSRTSGADEPLRSNPLSNPVLDDKERVEMRRLLVEQLHIQRNSARSIARQLSTGGYSVSFKTICKDIIIIKERWMADIQSDTTRIRSEAFAEIAELKRRIWSGITTTQAAGNQHYQCQGYIAQLIKVLEREAKMMGLDPVQRTPGDAPDNPMYVRDDWSLDYSWMSTEALIKERNRLIELGMRGRN